jgi:endo-1,4-beta-xylanase
MIKKLLTICLLLQICAAYTRAQSQQTKGLKDYYKDYFPIGTAVAMQDLRNPGEVKLIQQQFNSITPENSMKMAPIHPEENRYNWKDADSIVAFVQANGLRVRGHNLCWHEQVPDWFFKDANGNLVTKEVLLKRLKDHITTVVNRYKGKIYAWDVVNEAIDDDSTKFLRNSLWYQICGDDYIIKAFEYAHEADPNAVLFYNDYNTERPEKRERVYKLLKLLVDAKVPINAVGIQAHWSIYEPTQADLVETIKKFSSLGLKIQVTEMDVSIYPWEKNRRTKKPGELDAYTPELEKKQAEKYADMFKIFRQYKNVITGVTFWNIYDGHTWLDQYPVAGRKNYPLLFDQNLQPKKAYWDVVNFK